MTSQRIITVGDLFNSPAEQFIPFCQIINLKCSHAGGAYLKVTCSEGSLVHIDFVALSSALYLLLHTGSWKTWPIKSCNLIVGYWKSWKRSIRFENKRQKDLHKNCLYCCTNNGGVRNSVLIPLKNKHQHTFYAS